MVAGVNSLGKSWKSAVWNSRGGGCGGWRSTQGADYSTDLCSDKEGEGMSKKSLTPITVPVCPSKALSEILFQVWLIFLTFL